MMTSTTTRTITTLAALAVLASCGSRGSDVSGPSESTLRQRANVEQLQARDRETIWDLFGNRDDPNRTVEVNRYIWSAAQEVLDFLPLETADPFSGVLVYGYGQPPGGGAAYRATVYVQDPALDARSLNVAIATQGGPVNAATTRAIEDAILTRARQLRIAAAEL